MIEIYILLFILGLCIGSFLGVLVDRLSNDETILGRSHCDFCKKTLPAAAMVPLISFLVQGGKSACCGKKLSWFYPIIELLTAVTFAGGYFYWGLGWQLLPLLTVFSALIVIFFADIKYHIIPDEATAAILFVGIISAVYRGILVDRLIAGCVLFLIMHGLYLITQKKGIGYGDVKLAGVFGVYLGLIGGFLSLYLAFVIGGVVSLALIALKQKKLKSRIAFGPFMVIGIALMIVWGSEIARFLKGYLRF